MLNSFENPGSTIAMDGPVCLRDDGIRIHQVPTIRATRETFEHAGYGVIIHDFDRTEVDIVTWPQPDWREVVPGTGNEGGITQGEFVFTWEGDMAVARNHAVDGHYITGWFCNPATASFNTEGADRSRLFVREANYHPDGSQVFFPKAKTPFIALLALPGDNVRPEDFVAFYCDGTFGIKIHPNIWHQPLFPLRPRAVFDDKQGRVHACIAVDFVAEFQTYLQLDMKAPD